MFINNLTPDQQGYLLSLCHAIAAADGNIVEAEQQILADLKSQSHPNSPLPDDPFSKLEDHFDDHKSKVSLLLELLGIAYVDSHYDESEAGIITRVADKLKVNKALLSDLENWVTRQMLLVKEAHVFMEV